MRTLNTEHLSHCSFIGIFNIIPVSLLLPFIIILVFFIDIYHLYNISLFYCYLL